MKYFGILLQLQHLCQAWPDVRDPLQTIIHRQVQTGKSLDSKAHPVLVGTTCHTDLNLFQHQSPLHVVFWESGFFRFWAGFQIVGGISDSWGDFRLLISNYLNCRRAQLSEIFGFFTAQIQIVWYI